MKVFSLLFGAAAFGAAILGLPRVAAAAQTTTLVVDATHAARGLFYVHEQIPAHAGAFTLVYPKWIPGEHSASGPLNDLAALRLSSNGTPLAWHRDLVNMYAFHVDVPAGATTVDADFDVLANGDRTMATRSVAIVNWNRVLLYEEGAPSHADMMKPSIELPAGWTYATALRDPVQSGNRVDFALTPLSMLIDSPLDMGQYGKQWELWRDGSAFVQLDAFADHPQDLDIPAPLLHAYQRLPLEAFALYGSRHFIDYHALLTLSNAIGFEGIEHHQSSDNRAPDDFLTNPLESVTGGDLIPHEFSHSWNGKYRRPADLTTPNFQVPEETDLLWVYEGMNEYLGNLLSFRSGIRNPKGFPEQVAMMYANMDTEPGRDTTPIIDLTTGAPYYYTSGQGPYTSIRRNAGDFYTEGELIWLDADTIIRERSHGQRSLDTFLHLYTQPAVTGPITVTYTRAQIEALLEKVQPYDWHGFFQKYVYSVAVHPPSDDFARAGWKFVYNGGPSGFLVG